MAATVGFQDDYRNRGKQYFVTLTPCDGKILILGEYYMTTLKSTTEKNKSWIDDSDFFKQAKDAVQLKQAKAKAKQIINSWTLYNANW